MDVSKVERNINIEELQMPPIEKQGVEIVERKGQGHPDSMADGLSESVSRALCKMYKEREGIIKHHNTDETQIVGGHSNAIFGDGEVTSPIGVILVGRATPSYLDKGTGKERPYPYKIAAYEAAKEYLQKTVHHLDVYKHVKWDVLIGKGSKDLTSVYDTSKQNANDTSFGVGFAPFSETETITFETERLINRTLKNKYPQVGEDIKVMSYRQDDRIKMTIAAAMVSSELSSVDEYLESLASIKEEVAKFITTKTDRDFSLDVNTADIPEENTYYLTVTGTSAEAGDDGSVGRGNRANGLITPFRPMSMEASAGKNPVTHVGKLYNILSNKAANRVIDEMGDCIEEIHIFMLSQINKPIDDPQIASVRIIPKGCTVSDVAADVRSIIDEEVAGIHKLTDEFVAGKHNVF